jgi:hypothetical protein
MPLQPLTLEGVQKAAKALGAKVTKINDNKFVLSMRNYMEEINLYATFVSLENVVDFLNKEEKQGEFFVDMGMFK